jgi:hypothetical protein
VTGPRDMIFSLYSQSDCAAGFLKAQNIPDVLVNNGLFNQSVLDYDNYGYDGRRLWLKVTVSNTHVSCQEITPVPLAMGLVPNALIWGNSPKSILTVMNDNEHGLPALEGYSRALTGSSVGLRGISSSPGGIGVEAIGGYGHYGAALSILGSIKVNFAGIGTDTPVFIHQVNTAVGGNICQVQNYSTVIDNKVVNGIEDAMLIVTPNYGPKNGGTAPAVGIPAVYYDADNECGKGAGRWVIYNLNAQPQTNNSRFNVMAVVP